MLTNLHVYIHSDIELLILWTKVKDDELIKTMILHVHITLHAEQPFSLSKQGILRPEEEHATKMHTCAHKTRKIFYYYYFLNKVKSFP